MFRLELEESMSNAVDRPVYDWECPLCGDKPALPRNLLPGYVLGAALGHLLDRHAVRREFIEIIQPKL